MQKCQQNYSIIILLQNWYSYSLFMFVGAFLMLIHILNTFIRNLTLQQRQMGITDTKTISLNIDSEFKSIRKYHDHLYGEITLVQQKSTGKMFALVEKVILSADKSLAQFLTLRKQFSPYLVKLHDFYHCSVDYCSGLEKYFFLLEYSSHTLYRQMAQRQQLDNKFTLEELFDTFNSYLQMMSFLRDKSQLFKSFISNHYILYSSPKQMKTVEILFKIEKDQFQNDFHLIKNYQGSKQLYLAPEAFQLLCNREKLKAKYVSLREEAIVFMLGMNFIECALLADISGVYDYFGKSISFDRLMKAVQQVNFFYGEETSQIIFQMVSLNPADRPSIQSIKDFVKLNLKRRKIVIPKHSKVQQSKQKQLRV